VSGNAALDPFQRDFIAAKSPYFCRKMFFFLPHNEQENIPHFLPQKRSDIGIPQKLACKSLFVKSRML
jgi:hypothetical protein